MGNFLSPVYYKTVVAKIIASPQFCIEINVLSLLTVYFCAPTIGTVTINVNDSFSK